jgi:hypothetical protein
MYRSRNATSKKYAAAHQEGEKFYGTAMVEGLMKGCLSFSLKADEI